MTDVVLLTILSFTWIIFGTIVIYYRKQIGWYVAPYLIFQLGISLFVISIVFIRVWTGIGYGIMGTFIVGIALFLFVIVGVYYHSKYRV
ncbi:hypothetical protein [Pseudalkalibacillus decolorationis]|uniref:hypothetical protein n=1 Tax=Pseudalkalibacillus decolorationis TaxID=163879 RepID=UPI002148066B|nr:hypothetical protein [Pseudalkalibacillus decolorationis]